VLQLPVTEGERAVKAKEAVTQMPWPASIVTG